MNAPVAHGMVKHVACKEAQAAMPSGDGGDGRSQPDRCDCGEPRRTSMAAELPRWTLRREVLFA